MFFCFLVSDSAQENKTKHFYVYFRWIREIEMMRERERERWGCGKWMWFVKTLFFRCLPLHVTSVFSLRYPHYLLFFSFVIGIYFLLLDFFLIYIPGEFKVPPIFSPWITWKFGKMVLKIKNCLVRLKTLNLS